MDTADTKSVEKKRLLIFIVIAYCVSFLMMIPMYIGKQKGIDLTQIVNAQMCSPAAGVALGFLVCYKGEKRVPKMFMGVLIVNYVLQIILGLLSVFANPFGPDDVIDLAKLAGSSGDTAQLTGAQTTLQLSQIYTIIGQYVLIICSVLLWIGYFVARKEGRKFAGLARNKEGIGILLVLLFIVLYLVRNIGPLMLDGLFNKTMPIYQQQYSDLIKNPLFILSLISLPVNYLLTIIAFLGEEYGWRYFLMPRLTKKFGGRLGVIILGVIWGLWHLPINMFFYSPDTALQSIVLQVIACICFAIFFAWAYYKTDCNIWVVTAIHFFNNNLGACFTEGGDGSNQTYTWEMVGIMALLYIALVALPFIFSKVFSKKGVPSFEKEATVALASEQEAIETV